MQAMANAAINAVVMTVVKIAVRMMNVYSIYMLEYFIKY